ncbi:sialidase 3 (membrane sialidase), tandem duplicate 3 [Danio aesculapii]|uniref:sialidase 3 (membrane sialidase), tandem duplicate 3 n=1 Tax=Danio aesculapii TaxID=1142201 RepID=UPI0024C02EE9|nr:sialidase 3 (membrane sialidase), tandem duplicate 3 [Danio aesculapii]XP_056303121.1 sialidase 3 (membrane sialidase), tandem duplicate 3 [Danio aesculapii]XP_056303122.1 sialidase 3 (membrane sialidase), tandem duplicate 3 [Danio aesculapii]
MGNKTPSRSKSGCSKEMNTTTVFKQEQPQTWCCCFKKQVSYRIPALIYVSDEQTFLAFAEKRKTLNDTSAEVLVMRRGTWVDAKTKEVEWVSGHQVLSSACLPNHRSMNPCPVYEKDSKTLFLFFVCVPTQVSEFDQIRTNKSQGRLCYVASKDAGKTWSQTIDLTADVIGEQVNEWAPFAVGPGHGVQTKSGRLIIPAYAYRYTGKTDCTSFCCLSFCCFTPYALAFYSDDQGITWKAGQQMDVESCECQMAEIVGEKGGSTLYCNARTRLGYRTEALSNNAGEDFDTVLSSNKLIETGKGCQGSVLSFLEQSSPPQTWLLYSHPSHPKKRVDLGLYLNKSPLDSSGWSDEPLMILHHGPSAYSDLVEFEPGHFACLMECGKEHENEEIAFLLFKLPEKKL